ncbi:TonB family protein [Pseudomonas sp. TE3786]
MLHTAKWILALAFIASLSGCQRYVSGTFTKAASATEPLEGQLEDKKHPGQALCTYFPDCEADTVFPGRQFDRLPKDVQGCVATAAIDSGRALYPKDVSIQAPQTVWLAVAVSSTGLPEAIKVISSTDARFDRAAYHTTTSMRFRPLMCNGAPYDSYVKVPLVFAPRKNSAPISQSEAQALYDNNQLYPNDRQLP